MLLNFRRTAVSQRAAIPGVVFTALALLLGASHAWAKPAAPASASATACDLQWTLQPRLDASPRHLEASLSFPAEGRTRTRLMLPTEWAGVSDQAQQVVAFRAGAAHQQVLPGDGPAERVVVHGPGERVTVRWRVLQRKSASGEPQIQRHRDLYVPQFAEGWFQFFGHGVIVLPQGWEGSREGRMCLQVQGLPAGSLVASSHGSSRQGRLALRLNGSASAWRDALYLGGPALSMQTRQVAGSPVHTVLHPASGHFAFSEQRFADGVATLIGTHRQFWGDHRAQPLLVLLRANTSDEGNYGGTAVHQALAMHGAKDFQVPGQGFDFLVGHEHLHTWIPERFGAMTEGQAEDEALRYWFSEGFTNFYTHRLLLRSGLWNLERYAQELNLHLAEIHASPVREADNQRVLADFFRDEDVSKLPYRRGEFLALRWHRALLAQQRPGGLDSVMRRLMLPLQEGPAPAGANSTEALRLATDRLLDALDGPLAGQARADVAQVVDRGQPISWDDGSLGPCFSLQWVSRPRFSLGFERRSMERGVLEGVDPQGPAHAAGLRDGMPLAALSVQFGRTDRPVKLSWLDAQGRANAVEYAPVSAQMLQLPQYSPRPQALANPACRAWFSL